jgi:hypothetical protein
VTRNWASFVDRFAKVLIGRPPQPRQSGQLVQHRRRDARQMRPLGDAVGLKLVGHEIPSVNLFPAIRPIVARLNAATSAKIGGKPHWRWITAWSGTNLICRFERE